MRLHVGLTVSMFLLGSGCASVPPGADGQSQGRTAEAKAGPLASVCEGLQSSWHRLAHPESTKLNAPWEWVTALPNGGSRGDSVVPTLTGAALAVLVPHWQPSEVQLAAAATGTPDYRIAAVNDLPVSNCDQLHAAMQRTLGSGKSITVRVTGPGEVDKTAASVPVGPAQLLTLVHAAAPGEKLLRVTEDGNPWILLRQDNVRCKVTVRVERHRAILQMAMSVGVCGRGQVRLPQEVRATCGGVPLHCLSVAETLDVLYGGARGTTAPCGGDATSFAAVSERDDYRIPTNYKRLEQSAEKTADPGAKPRGPALLSLLGLVYPGAGLLADARALATFAMQRQICRAGEPERGGWIIFGGEALQHCATIDLDIDLGKGPQRLTFTLPNP